MMWQEIMQPSGCNHDLDSYYDQCFDQGGEFPIVFLPKPSRPEELAAGYKKLEYKDGQFRKLGDDADEDIAHVHGVSVAKSIDEKDPDVGMYLQESVYVPKSVTV